MKRLICSTPSNRRYNTGAYNTGELFADENITVSLEDTSDVSVRVKADGDNEINAAQDIDGVFNESVYEDIAFVMNHYVDDQPINNIRIKSVEYPLIYTLLCDGIEVELQFLPTSTCKYCYTIDGTGPYEHDSYEYIARDIEDYVFNNMPD